jgi:putative transcriptional regulator
VLSFIETRLFTKLVLEYLTDEEYGALQEELARHPEAGAVIPGSGGVRKMRWAPPGRGKRGGYHVIYYVRRPMASSGCSRCIRRMCVRIFPPTFFDRSVRKWKMARSKRNVGQEILGGLRELKRGEYGRVINVPDVAGIRERTGLSQTRFASLLGVSVRTLQDWEQGRRAPSGAARTLLLVADRNPKALLEVA